MKYKKIISILVSIKEEKTKTKTSSCIFIARAFDNVIKKIMSLHDEDDSAKKSEIIAMDITTGMKRLILEIMANPSQFPTSLNATLTSILGIGSKLADKLIKAGLRHQSDLKKEKYFSMLPDDVKIQIKYNPRRRIPHDFIKIHEKKIAGFPGSKIVGSYRRKKPFSTDIDLMLCGNEKILDEYLSWIPFKTVVYSRGPSKMSTLIKIGKRYYKLDAFVTSPEERLFMLLYSTGSKEFNIRMRANAKRAGYLLNQRGLFRSGRKIKVSSEKEIFELVNMSYVPPHKR